MNDLDAPFTPQPNPIHEARRLVVLLGWDWWDAIRDFENATNETLHAVLDILRPTDPNEDDYHKKLSDFGTFAALRLLHRRAAEAGRLDDDGCPFPKEYE